MNQLRMYHATLYILIKLKVFENKSNSGSPERKLPLATIFPFNLH